jgi:hypothetical protein
MDYKNNRNAPFSNVDPKSEAHLQELRSLSKELVPGGVDIDDLQEWISECSHHGRGVSVFDLDGSVPTY